MLRLATLFGIEFSPKKRASMSSWLDFQGHTMEFAPLVQDYRIVFGIITSTREKAVPYLRYHLEVGTLSSGDGSTLRGICTWIDTGLCGKPCRGAMSSLIARQYWQSSPGDQLTSGLRLALEYLLAVVLRLSPGLFTSNVTISHQSLSTPTPLPTMPVSSG